MASLRKALEGTDIEDIKAKTKELQDAAMKLSQKAYEEAAKASQATQNSSGAPENKDDKDNVQEAKYEEK